MHPLDNVIWRALTTRQGHLGESYQSARKFNKEVSLLGGFAEPSLEGYASMAGLLAEGERVGMFLEEAVAAPGFEVVSSMALLQMARESDDVPAPVEGERKPEFVALTESDVPEMMALTELTKPGPFNRRTREMGDYFGVRSNGRLVAMAGERLCVPGYTEVSAVCTHPDHLGRGYAAALMTMIVGRILDRGERPFLHVRPENSRAVALYERLGFEKRLWNRYVILQKQA
jgi:ribosomal protein S18 acetylase RimI-like enzyme